MTNPSIEAMPQSMLSGSLARKYAVVLGALVGVALLVSGLVDTYFSYRENKAALIAMQRDKAEASARRIEQYINDIEQRIAFTTPPARGASLFDHRLREVEELSYVPAITEAALLDTNGNPRLYVSRLHQMDPMSRPWPLISRIKSGKPYRSPVYFLNEAEPYISIAMAVGPKEAGVTVAEVDLESLLEGIRSIKVGKAGHAYAVDGNGRLIAHPDLNLVLKKIDLSKLPQVEAVLADASCEHALSEGLDLAGKPVLTSCGYIPQLGWHVFVEQPLSEAYAPLYASVLRTAALLAAGLALSLGVAVWLARRMVRPIHALKKGVMLIGSGELEHRIHVHTGDELEQLAEHFNRMGSRLQESYSNLEDKVRARTEELEQANRALEDASITDPLTGLRNRRFLLQMLDADIALVLRRYDDWLHSGGTPPKPSMDLVFFIVDVDHFKAVNDEHGHAAGDAILSQIPQRLREVFRESDYLIRWGGEEFLIVARAIPRSEAGLLAERICAAVAQQAFRLDDGTLLQKTCSVGYACFPFVPERPHLLSWIQAVELADRALYRSKHGGRNTWNGIVAVDDADSTNLFERIVHDLDNTVANDDVLIVSGKDEPETATTDLAERQA